MGKRNKQHLGRSAGDDRELIGRDVRDGDETAERASPTALPMPNEEGTGPAGEGGSHDFGSGSRGNAASDEQTQRRGGSGE